MSKPVNKLEFWKERIEYADKVKEHFSVYITHENHWKHINDTHEKILKEHATGKVLDAGCGYGRWSELFTDYVGVDFSPDFINKAKSKYPSKEFIVGNLKELPFKDKEFDTAFCVSIKKMIQDNLGNKEWDLMEKELKRVAKKVLILEYETPEPFEII
jgi:ubiquinone/menaquinone biosynthesis C-methylase UbiE